jgi:hypothetical protein
MAEVIPFPSRFANEADDSDIDLLTAIDAAIRDLRDIAERWDPSSRLQAEECRLMLERAYAAAVFCQG